MWLAIVLAMAAHLAWGLRARWRRAALSRQADHAAVLVVLPDAVARPGAVGVVVWSGTWRGQRVQIQTVIDTLSVRKLPARWLMVTVLGPVAVAGVTDLMLRPAGPTTFSNFDHLPHTHRTPPGWPPEAVIRGDRAGPLPDLGPHLGLFDDPHAKELLVTPDGVRLVWLLAEADRARYGVFREAAFDQGLAPDRIAALVQAAAHLRSDLNRNLLQVAG